MVWALPGSLATTSGIIIIFFSYGYLDVSVPHVSLPHKGMIERSLPGCPIRKSQVHAVICTSPELIAAYHVLLRLQEPRHPPSALSFTYRLFFQLQVTGYELRVAPRSLNNNSSFKKILLALFAFAKNLPLSLIIYKSGYPKMSQQDAKKIFLLLYLFLFLPKCQRSCVAWAT